MLLCLSFFALSLSATLYAQSLSLFNIVDSAFPSMRANVAAYTAQGQQILSSQSFRLAEDNQQRTILSYSCPIQQQQPVSAVLAIDVSLSMEIPLLQTREKRIEVVQLAATAFVNGLPQDGSESAVVAFADESFIAQDFTSDKDRLRQSINSLRLLFGTNYESAFLGQPGGALPLFNRAKHTNRALVFLTDGESSVNTPQVIQEARRLGVTIYCVSVGLQMPPSLDSIARATGGRSFSNIQSSSDLLRIYSELSALIRQNTPCTIEWMSDVACRRETRAITLTSSALPPSLVASASYIPPQALAEQIRITPATLSLGEAPANQAIQGTITVSLAPGSQPRRIQRFVSPDSTIIRINNATPVALTPGSPPTTLNLTYRSPGSGYRFFTLNAELDNGCRLQLFVTAGRFGERPIIPTLNLVRPDGGEVFLVGTNTTITWNGVPPSESVILDMSIDSGKTWRNVDSNAASLNRAWIVPNTPSDSCLMRVRQKNPNTAPLSNDSSLTITLFANTPAEAVKFRAQNSSRIITWVEQRAIILDSNGVVLQTIPISGSVISDADIHENGTFVYLLRTPDVANVVVSRPISPTQYSTYSFRDFSLALPTKVRLNPANSRELVIVNNSTRVPNINVARIDPNSFGADAVNPMGALPESQSTNLINIEFSSDGSIILATYFSSIKVWRNQIPFQAPLIWQAPTNRFTSHAQAIRLPNGSLRIAVACGNEIRFLRIERTAGGREELVEDATLPPLQSASGAGVIIMSSFDRTGTYLVMALGDGRAEVYDVERRALITVLQHSTSGISGIVSAYFNSSTSRIVTAGTDGRVVISILTETQPIQTDVSNALWRIVRPSVNANPITMGSVVVGALKDSIVPALSNFSAFPVTVKRIWFASNNSTNSTIVSSTNGIFTVVSGNAPLTVPAAQGASSQSTANTMAQGTNGQVNPSQHFLEIRFRPRTAGTHTDTLYYETLSGDIVRAPITGIGLNLGLELTSSIIDWKIRPLFSSNDTVQALLHNRGTQPVRVVLPSILTQFTGETTPIFSVLGFALGNTRPMSISTNPIVLAVGDSARLSIRFVPPRVERFNTRLLFRFDEWNFSTTAQLFGIGAIPGAMLRPEDVSVPFALQNIGQCSPTITLRLFNSGTESLIIRGLDILEPNSERVSRNFVLLNRSTTISPGSIGTITLQFTPQTSGLTTASLRIRSNSVGGDISVRLQGRSERPELVFEPRNIVFPPLEQGVSTTLTIRVRNQGNTDVAWHSALQRFRDNDGVERFQLSSAPPLTRLAPNAEAVLSLRFLGGQSGETYSDSSIVEDSTRCFRQSLAWTASVNSQIRLQSSQVPVLTTCERSAVREFTIQNVGMRTSNFLEYTIQPPNPSVRLLGTKDTLRIGESVTVRVFVDSLPRNSTLSFSIHVRERRNSAQQHISPQDTATLLTVPIQIIKREVGLEIQPKIIMLGEVESNATTQASVMIRNRSSQTLLLPRQAADGGNFRLESPQMLMPFDSALARVVFDGAPAHAMNSIDMSDMFVVSPMPIDGVGCAVTPDTIRVSVRILPPRSATLVLTDIIGSPGDTVIMRALLQNRVRIPLGTVLIDTLRFNPTLLQPLAPLPLNPPILGERIIPLRFTVSSDNPSEPIALLRFRAALGNDTTTTMRLSGTPTNRSLQMTINASNATFRLTGVARAGGLRLIIVSLGTITNLTLRPIPASSQVTLEFNSALADMCSLYILNVFGNRVDNSLFAEQRFSVGVGTQSKTLDISRIPAGTYFLHLRNSRELVSARLVITR